jgi:hypothetical protein
MPYYRYKHRKIICKKSIENLSRTKKTGIVDVVVVNSVMGEGWERGES